MATRIIYTNPNSEIKYEKESDSYSVRAKADLDVGSLILIEHVFSGSSIEAHALLFLDDELRELRAPDTEPGDSEANELKISMNATGN